MQRQHHCVCLYFRNYIWHAWQTSNISSITWTVHYWCPLRHCAYDHPRFPTPSSLFCMRKEALFWSNVCTASRHTTLDAPHYLRRQSQEDCGITKSLTHTAIRQLIPSARQISKNGCVNSLSDDKAQSVGEQTVPGVSCDPSPLPGCGPKLIFKLLQLWNKLLKQKPGLLHSFSARTGMLRLCVP